MIVGKIKVGLVGSNVLLIHLVGAMRKLFGRKTEQAEKQLSM